MSDLVFSRQVLRGLSLQAQADTSGARRLWLQMIAAAEHSFQRPSLDLALAWNYEHDDKLAAVFASDSPIRDPAVREILLRNDAGPALLVAHVRAQDAAARERRLARFVLLYKDLLRGRYSAFAADLALSPPKAEAAPDLDNPLDVEPNQALFDWPGAHDQGGYACEGLPELAKVLSVKPAQPHALLCLGEFVRLKDLDGNPLDTPPPADELGGAPAQFPGRVFARLDAYRLVVADAKAPAGDRAYALYRAVNCYGPSGYNHCGGEEASKSERAHWFHTLKTVYAGSDWATALKYYW